jgi:hypothetical protein
MQLYTFNVTDLTTYDSPILEEWLDQEEVGLFAKNMAHLLVETMPGLGRRGLCVAVFDEDGISVTLAPLDAIH